MALLVDHNRLHIGRRQGANHELRRILRPQDDVHTLTGQLIGHCRHARTTHAHAGADRVHPFVVGYHGDLGARPRIAGATLDLQQALLDLGHFLGEQLHHEARRAARKHDLRATNRGVNACDERAHAVATAQVFLGDHLVALESAFHTTAFDDDVALVQALDGAHHDLLATGQEIVEQLLTLGVANLLQDHLLGSLRTDAADGHRFDGLLDVIALFDFTHPVDGVGQQFFRIRVLKACRIGHHQPTAEGLVFTTVAIDRDADVHLTAIQAFGGRGQRGLHGTENDFTVHALLA